MRGKGEAGGIVFYDKGSFSDGWRFMEISPVDLPKATWGGPSYPSLRVDATVMVEGAPFEGSAAFFKRDIGRGKSNTIAIVDSALVHNTGVIGATECFDYSLNGFDDWYLPSGGEAELIRANLMQSNQNNPANLNLTLYSYYGYSSSSPNTAYLTSSYRQTGSIFVFDPKYVFPQSNRTLLNVRAIRYF